MKTLTLLRHAKSGWDDPQARDFDRALNDKGRRAAATVGRHWREQGLTFDHVLASPAARVVETLDALAAGYGKRLQRVYDRKLYLASAETLADAARAFPAEAERGLIVAHNPGLEELVALLTGADEPERLPTACTVELTFDCASWSDLAAQGVVARFVRPRDLDPSLGPDPD